MRNSSQRVLLSVLSAGLAVLVLAGSCGGSSSTPAVSVRQAAHQGSSAEDSSFLERHLKELGELPLPDGVDPKLWASIKDGLRESLVEKYSGKQSSYYGSGEGKTHYYVVPRDFDWDAGGTYGKLVWTYVNDGDYDQSGVVSIADIALLAA